MYRALKNLMLVAGVAVASPAFAGVQPVVAIGSDSGLPTDVIVIPVNYSDPGNDVAGVDIDIEFTASQYSSVTIDCTGQTVGAGTNFCSDSDAPSGKVDLILARFDGQPFTAGLMAEITFTIDAGATAGSDLLDGIVIGISDSTGTDLPNNTIEMMDGQITVQGPDAEFTPAPGPLDLGSVQMGGSDPTANVDIDNVGATGTTLTGTCSETADPGGVFTLSGDTSFSVGEAEAADTVTVSCDANAAANTYSGEMTCTHNGDGTTHASPSVFNLSCTVTPGPAPAYSSNPAAGSILNFGTVPKGDPNPTQAIDITNSGDVGTTLDGTCSIPNNPNGAYALVGGGGFSVPQGDPADTITVECDTSVPGTHDGGVLSCSHNGSNASPATYTLNCTIPPEPSIATTLNPDPLNLGPVPQNNTDPTGTLTIDNDGDSDSTLSGNCSLTDGSGPITIQSGGGAYSVPEAGPDQVVTVACDSSELPGVYNDTLSCTHDDDSQGSPVNFPVSCEIGQPDPAVFGSTPPSGSTLDFNAGGSVVMDDPDPTLPLEIRNDAMAGDADMDVTCSLNQVMGTAISVDPAVTNVILAPSASQNVTFTCDTMAVGTFEATYDCNWSSVFVEGGEEPAGEGPQGGTGADETYTITCEVIDAESEVDPETPSGTEVVQLVEPGGSATYEFTFNEVLDEGADGELDCSLDDGSAGFTIQSPSFPAPVPSGGSTTVVVDGTDPGGVESTTDTLRCTYTDTGNPEGVEVFYDLVLLIGGNASFMVTKDFTDDNPGEVLVSLSCDTGLPLDQSKLISEAEYVKFIVGDFDSGEMDCTVTESVPDGYSASYDASGSASAFVDDDPDEPGCHFSAISGGDDNFCAITNSPDPVNVVITKEWIFEGDSMNAGVKTDYQLTLWCDAEIVGGINIYDDQEAPAGDNGIGCGLVKKDLDQSQGFLQIADWCQNFFGNGPDQFIGQVIPEYPDSSCFVTEFVSDSAVEVDNDCDSITVSAGQGDACTITNTVFFEGIPTLSQYGLAVLALLMLGIGMVGFRRYA